jgi:hypothetical protein
MRLANRYQAELAGFVSSAGDGAPLFVSTSRSALSHSWRMEREPATFSIISRASSRESVRFDRGCQNAIVSSMNGELDENRSLSRSRSSSPDSRRRVMPSVLITNASAWSSSARCSRHALRSLPIALASVVPSNSLSRSSSPLFLRDGRKIRGWLSTCGDWPVTWRRAERT